MQKIAQELTRLFRPSKINVLQAKKKFEILDSVSGRGARGLCGCPEPT